MPLHDVSYQRYRGSRTTSLARSWAIARTQARQLLKRRSFLLLLAASWIPVVARTLQIYVTLSFPQTAELFPVTPRLWFQFLTQQVYFLPVILIALYVGAPTIASDINSGALLAYLSKPISVLDYIVGKALPVACAIGSITVVPALLLLGLHLALAGELELLTSAPWLPFAILGYGLLLTLYFALAVLAVSCLSRSGRVAGAGFVAFALGSEILVRGALSRLHSGFVPSFLSVTGAAIDSGHLFFGTADSGHTPLLSGLAVLALLFASILVLRRRLHTPEVLT